MVQPRKFSLIKRAAVVQISLRKIKPQHAIAHQAGSRHQHRQDFLIAQPRKVHMLQRVLGTADGDGDTDVVRNQRQHVRSALHELLHVGNPMQRILNNALVFLRKAGLARKLFYIIAIRF